MLRDWIHIFQVEDQVANRDAIYLQPIDRWMRLVAPLLLEETDAANFPDWILAGKVGKAARTAGVSGIRLNMGVSWLGRESGSWSGGDEHFALSVQRLTSTPAA